MLLTCLAACLFNRALFFDVSFCGVFQSDLKAAQATAAAAEARCAAMEEMSRSALHHAGGYSADGAGHGAGGGAAFSMGIESMESNVKDVFEWRERARVAEAQGTAATQRATKAESARVAISAQLAGCKEQLASAQSTSDALEKEVGRLTRAVKQARQEATDAATTAADGRRCVGGGCKAFGHLVPSPHVFCWTSGGCLRRSTHGWSHCGSHLPSLRTACDWSLKPPPGKRRDACVKCRGGCSRLRRHKLHMPRRLRLVTCSR